MYIKVYPKIFINFYIFLNILKYTQIYSNILNQIYKYYTLNKNIGAINNDICLTFINKYNIIKLYSKRRG